MKYLLLLTIIFSACTPQPAVVAPVVPADPAICKKGDWCWSILVASKLTPAMLQANVSSICPAYRKLGAETVWVNIVRSISYAESAWNPGDVYTESSMGTDPVTGKQVVSEGLLQLSYQDAVNWKSVPDCAAIDYKKKNIQDPILNLKCGLGIMDRLAKRGGAEDISSKNSLGSYWSTIRLKHDDSRKKMKLLMPECGL
jgi:hypothetical protein